MHNETDDHRAASPAVPHPTHTCPASLPGPPPLPGATRTASPDAHTPPKRIAPPILAGRTTRTKTLFATLALLAAAACGSDDDASATSTAWQHTDATGPSAEGSGSATPTTTNESTSTDAAGTSAARSTALGVSTSSSTLYAPRVDTLEPEVSSEGAVTLQAQLFPTTRPWPLRAAGFCWSREIGIAAALHPDADPLDASVTCGEVTTLPQRPWEDLLLTLEVGALETATTWYAQAWAENDEGRTLGGVVDFFTAPPAPAAEATQGSFINRVVISWEAPPADWGDAWDEVRIFRGEGETPVHVEREGETRSWADRDAPRPQPSVADVNLQVGEQPQGALLTWDAAEIPESPRETWRVVGVLGGRASAPTEVEGWVLRSEVVEYAYTTDGGATWVETRDARGWVVEDAPAPILQTGTLTLADDEGEDVLVALGFSIEPGEAWTYQVRAAIDGAVSDLSAPVTYARSGGSPQTWRWQRSLDETSWEEVATTPAEENALAPEQGWFYRVALQAPHTTTAFSAPIFYDPNPF